jgi:hypothetical protein
MADKKIDCSAWPSMTSVQCGGGNCNEWIIVDGAFTGTGYCSACLHARVGGDSLIVAVDPPDAWFSAHNPGPPSAVYPPSPHTGIGIRTGDPDVAGRCLAHHLTDPAGDLRLLSLDPADIHIAMTLHRQQHHDPFTVAGGRPIGWLIGGPGGADGDICNPCGGGGKDKAPLVTTVGGDTYTGPRHDLCLRGNPRGGWGRNCPCTHDRPHMRGIKPGSPDPAARTVQHVQDILDDHHTPPAIPIPEQGYLFDPEEDTDA